jgi:hypothetical protein
MTLIVSVIDGKGRLFALSDILLSTRVLDGNRSVSLPLRRESVQLSGAAHKLAGVAMKSVLLDSSHHLMWAGRQIVAEALIMEARRCLLAGELPPLHALVSSLGLNDTERASISILLHRVTARGIARETCNAELTQSSEDRIAYAGSGVFDFIHDTEPRFETEEPNPSLRLLRPWLMRLAHAFAMEDLAGDPLLYGYGGWHEITVVEQGRFRKWPYIIKFWRLLDGELLSYPVFVSWYAGEILAVARCEPLGLGKANIDVHLVLPPHQSEYIGDLGSLMALAAPPEAQLHLLLVDGDRMHIMLRAGSYSGYRADIQRDGIQTSEEEEVLSDLRALAAGRMPKGSIHRPHTNPE